MKSNFLKVLLLLSVSSLYAMDSYRLTVEVDATKDSGKAWDIAGGAPDILVKIDNTTIFKKECKNSYMCKSVFNSEKSKWYLEIYDKDLRASDLIGKGECEADTNCTLGKAKVTIVKEKSK